MSLSIKRYRCVHRNFLIKIIEKQREDIETYPVTLFNKNLEQDLINAGFFDKYNDIVWWVQDIDPITFRNSFRPDLDAWGRK